MEFLTPTFHSVERIDGKKIKFAVIAARYKDKWIFCRHRDRSTWELPGGHREPKETVLDAARRELYEETGATEFELHTVGVYKLNDYGLLAFAQISRLDPIPDGSEIEEIQLFDIIPCNLTYGKVHHQLFEWVQGWLNLQASADELWDVYDKERRPTGRLHRRGDYLSLGDYHLVVHIWMRNSRDQYLLTKRSPLKGFPNMWETTGGSALSGDDSLSAALREVREETGLELDPKRGERILSFRFDDHFDDIWLFRQDFSLDDVTLLAGETCDAMYADSTLIRQLDEEGMLVPYPYLDQVLNYK